MSGDYKQYKLGHGVSEDLMPSFEKAVKRFFNSRILASVVWTVRPTCIKFDVWPGGATSPEEAQKLGIELVRRWTQRSQKQEALSYLGRLGGKARSKAKARAARENAKLGGRPKGKKRAR